MTTTTKATAIASRDTRVIPVQRHNSVKTVTKLEDGSLRLELHSGQEVTLGPDDELFQAFAIYTVLNTETRKLA